MSTASFPLLPAPVQKGTQAVIGKRGMYRSPWGCLAKLWLVPHGSPNLPATDAKRSGAIPWLPFGMEGDWRGSLNNGKHFSKPPWRIPSSFFHTCFFSLSQFSICYPTHHPLERPKFFYPYEQIENPISVVFLQSFTLRKKRRKKRPSFESSATIIREGGVGGEKSRIKLWLCSSWLEKERCLPTYRHHDLICRRRYDNLLQTRWARRYKKDLKDK